MVLGTTVVKMINDLTTVMYLLYNCTIKGNCFFTQLLIVLHILSTVAVDIPLQNSFNILIFFWAEILTLIYILAILSQVNPTSLTSLNLIRLPLNQVEYLVWQLQYYLIISIPTMCRNWIDLGWMPSIPQAALPVPLLSWKWGIIKEEREGRQLVG